MKNLFEADSIRCSFGERQLLTDIYIKCETGEVVGFLGRNGTGKSTLLKIIFGIQQAEHCVVRINKQYFKPHLMKSCKIGYLPQYSFLPNLTVLRTIKLFLYDKISQEAVMYHPLIIKLLNQNCTDLSGGQQRLVEFLLLIHSEAKFLLLDEPFSGIEPIVKDEIKKLIKQYCTTKGFIITDHDYKHVLEISDRLMLLDNGFCRNIIDPAELEFYNYVPLGTFKS